MKSLILMIAALPAPAFAEGARIVFDCRTLTRCDAAGSCDVATDPHRFTFAPLARGTDEIDLYEVSYDEVPAKAEAPAGLRQCSWSEGEADRQTLLLNDDTHATWHRLRENDAGNTEIAFLRCEVLQ